MRRRLESRANGSVSLHVSRCMQGPRQATVPRRDERGCHARPTSSPTSPCWRGEYKGDLYNSSQSSGGRIVKSRRGWVLYHGSRILQSRLRASERKDEGQKMDLSRSLADMFGRGFWTAGDAYSKQPPPRALSPPESEWPLHHCAADDCRFACMGSQSPGPARALHTAAEPNTNAQGARRGPWLWYRRSPTCPRFWGQGFTTVRKPSRVYAFRLRGLPGRPKLFAP
jgi:hypothetical protein